MLGEAGRAEIDRLWRRKLDQDARGLLRAERHRNLEPASAELLAVLAAGIGARRILEVGGSSGISTIALAAAARRTGGILVSIEMEPRRQAEARETIERLGLSPNVDFVNEDAATAIPRFDGIELALIDCEKDDYVRFFDLLRLSRGALVVADNILSHDLSAYVAHVRAVAGASSITLPVGKGLEITRLR